VSIHLRRSRLVLTSKHPVYGGFADFNAAFSQFGADPPWAISRVTLDEALNGLLNVRWSLIESNALFFIVETGLTLFLVPFQKLVEGGMRHLAFVGYFSASINFSLFHGLLSTA